MTAIETYFLGPTDHRGSRYKAVALGTGHTLTIGADDRYDYHKNHQLAAWALIKKMGWHSPDYGDWYLGDGGKRGYVFVCALTTARLEGN